MVKKCKAVGRWLRPARASTANIPKGGLFGNALAHEKKKGLSVFFCRAAATRNRKSKAGFLVGGVWVGSGLLAAVVRLAKAGRTAGDLEGCKD